MSTITSKSTITSSLTNVTVHIGHSAPTTPKTDELVGFSYSLTDFVGKSKQEKNFSTACTGRSGNVLQLLAMVMAMSQLKKPANVTFVTDCQYILDTFAKLRTYVQAGWKTRTGTGVKNKEAWQCLIGTAKKGGHRFSIVKAEGLDAYKVDNCHLEAKKAINYQAIANLAPSVKAAPTPEAKTTSSLSSKSEPASKEAQTVPALPENKMEDIPKEKLEQLHMDALTPSEQPSSDSAPFDLPELPELPEEAKVAQEPPRKPAKPSLFAQQKAKAAEVLASHGIK